jgi:hypothetical protein
MTTAERSALRPDSAIARCGLHGRTMCSQVQNARALRVMGRRVGFSNVGARAREVDPCKVNRPPWMVVCDLAGHREGASSPIGFVTVNVERGMLWADVSAVGHRHIPFYRY